MLTMVHNFSTTIIPGPEAKPQCPPSLRPEGGKTPFRITGRTRTPAVDKNDGATRSEMLSPRARF